MANLNKIPRHYSFTNLPSVFDEEALTALEMCGRLASKVNEIITAYNSLDDETRAKLSEQDKLIFDRLNEMDKTINDGLAILTKELPGYMDNWLIEHPEITTTIQDGEIVLEKLHDSLKHQTKNGYLTPEMFGEIGTGNDAPAIQAALDDGSLPVLLAGDYTITSEIALHGNRTLIINGTLTSTAPHFSILTAGHHNKILGSGTLKGKADQTNHGISIQSYDTFATYYNEVRLADIRDFDVGVQLYNSQPSGKASYFNIVDGVVFTNCKIGLQLGEWANGNKLTNLTFYNCGVANSNTYGAILIGGSSEKYPIENMFVNISTTNAENCTSIIIDGPCQYNQFYGLQFENGGDNARGIFTNDETTFKNNAIIGMSDINNMGSSRGTDNTIILAYGGRNEMPELKTRKQYRPCSFTVALKSKDNFTIGDNKRFNVCTLNIPNNASVIVHLRACFVSGAADTHTCAFEKTTCFRRTPTGAYYCDTSLSSDGISVDSAGYLSIMTPDAGVGVNHYTKAYVELDIMTSYRDVSMDMIPGHYGINLVENGHCVSYKGDW